MQRDIGQAQIMRAHVNVAGTDPPLASACDDRFPKSRMVDSPIFVFAKTRRRRLKPRLKGLRP